MLRYPTQAKTRLEWGTQQRGRSVKPSVTTAEVSAALPFVICSSPSLPTAGCPIQARFWLEWDTAALDAPLFAIRSAAEDLQFSFPPTYRNVAQ